MKNEFLWVALALFSFFGLWGMKRLFGTIGLYVWMAFSIMTANIVVVVSVSLLGLTATLGNILYGSSFAVTDTLCELKGKKHAYRAVLIGLYVQICFAVIISGVTLFTPSDVDFAHPHFRAIFTILPRITIGSLVAFIISQSFDVWVFQKIYTLFPKRSMLWLRNNISTLASQCIDTLIFCIIAFYGLFPISALIEIIATTYLFKVVIALCDTPFIYLLTKKRKNAAA